ncbi:hypothetical protein C8035_v004053 [Colletotrichum spinosum]|uniref:Uncharacterized protein n=1 Tax=Colletotrichum spinosum TaxID=1347390 RepID=A0A4R8QMP9_9PEZI|nr:hypothetical protein C8035_v004053 [Colletotrichum spinosum]
MFFQTNLLVSESLSLLCILLLSCLVPISASPTKSAGTLLFDEQHLAKRVKTSFPSFPSDYDGRIEKGRWLKGLFPLTNEQAQDYNGDNSIASPFRWPEELDDWGWTTYRQRWPYSAAEKWPQYKDSLDEAFADSAFPVDKTKGIAYHTSHNRRFRFGIGPFGDPTGGHYTNVVNPPSGAVIFDSNFSPKASKAQSETHQGDVPDLDTLSDVSYFQWLRGCDVAGVDSKNVKLIFRAHITYQPSFDIIVEALRKSGHKKVPGCADRVTLQMNTDEGLAILGSTHGASTAWFLLQHKVRLGLKDLKEVTIWGSKGGFVFDTPIKETKLNLRFTVVDV